VASDIKIAVNHVKNTIKPNVKNKTAKDVKEKAKNMINGLKL